MKGRNNLMLWMNCFEAVIKETKDEDEKLRLLKIALTDAEDEYKELAESWDPTKKFKDAWKQVNEWAKRDVKAIRQERIVELMLPRDDIVLHPRQRKLRVEALVADEDLQKLIFFASLKEKEKIMVQREFINGSLDDMSNILNARWLEKRPEYRDNIA
ncbi:hypothetical protein Ciccas_014450, partial [Cichlidogyrus casuarinus]